MAAAMAQQRIIAGSTIAAAICLGLGRGGTFPADLCDAGAALSSTRPGFRCSAAGAAGRFVFHGSALVAAFWPTFVSGGSLGGWHRGDSIPDLRHHSRIPL